MVGKLKINLDKWLSSTWHKQCKNIGYVSSYHTDELLASDMKEKWVDESIFILNILSHKLQGQYTEDLRIVLVFTLNRSRKKNSVVEQLEYNSYDKVFTPPEIYLVRRDNNEFFSYIKNKSQVIENNDFQGMQMYYMEKWNYGFDRFLWIL